MNLVGSLWQVVYLDDGERGEDDLLDAAEVLVPDHLGLLPPPEHLGARHTVKHLWHLDIEKMVRTETPQHIIS